MLFGPSGFFIAVFYFFQACLRPPQSWAKRGREAGQPFSIMLDGGSACLQQKALQAFRVASLLLGICIRVAVSQAEGIPCRRRGAFAAVACCDFLFLTKKPACFQGEMLGILLDLLSLSFLTISKNPTSSVSIGLGTAGTQLSPPPPKKMLLFVFFFLLLFSCFLPPSLSPFLLTCPCCFSWPGFPKRRQWHCFTVPCKYFS